MTNNFKSTLQQLNEVVEITPTKFGSNIPKCNDYQFQNINNSIYTKFVYDEYLITVYYDNTTKSLNFGIESKDDDSEPAIISHKDSSFKISNMFTMYGKILYVFHQICIKYNIDKFCFYADPADKKLKGVYRSFIKFKKLEYLMNQIGFTYHSTKTHKIKSKFKPVPEEEYWFTKL